MMPQWSESVFTRWDDNQETDDFLGNHRQQRHLHHTTGRIGLEGRRRSRLLRTASSVSPPRQRFPHQLKRVSSWGHRLFGDDSDDDDAGENRHHHGDNDDELLGENNQNQDGHSELLNNACCDYYLDCYCNNNHTREGLPSFCFRRGGLPAICQCCYNKTLSSHAIFSSDPEVSPAEYIRDIWNKNGDTPPVPFEVAYNSWKKWVQLEQDKYKENLGRSTWAVTIHSNDSVIPTELFQIKRIMACIGWAIHGLIFEFIDGTTRTGFVNGVTSIHDMDAVKRRHPTKWIDVEEGDHVVAISGHNLARHCFLCHSLTLAMASGKTIEFASEHEPWRGDPFHFEIPHTALLLHVSFHRGKCIGLCAAESHYHLPITTSRVYNHLSKAHQMTYKMIQLCIQRMNSLQIGNGDKPLSHDLWSNILGYLRCSDLVDYQSSAVGRVNRLLELKQESNEKLVLTTQTA
jgi:hypothetical protein